LLTSVQAARLARAGPVTNALIGYSTLSKSQLASPSSRVGQRGLYCVNVPNSQLRFGVRSLKFVRVSKQFLPFNFYHQNFFFLNKADFWQVLQSFVLCFVFVSSGLVQDPANKGLASYLCNKFYAHNSFSTLDFSLMTQYVLSN